MEIIISLHVFFTLYLVGLVWFVQVVHYPLMGKVGKNDFPAYEQLHTRLTSYVVAPPMLVELGSVILICYQQFPSTFWGIQLVLVLLLWGSTFFIQVPLHGRLEKGFDEVAHRRLVRTNWIRTFLWSLRGILLVIFLFK